jgi:hypothetical protein
MKNIMRGFLGVLCLVLGLGSQTSQVLNVDAQVNSRFKIEINSNTVTFTRTMDPRIAPVIVQNEPPLQIRVKATRGFFQSVNLRIQANGILSDGLGHTIPIENVSWQAAGDGFTPNGQLTSAAQQLGRWSPSGVFQGTLAFSFQDNENFAPGIYTLVVTLSVSSN